MVSRRHANGEEPKQGTAENRKQYSVTGVGGPKTDKVMSKNNYDIKILNYNVNVAENSFLHHNLFAY